MTVDSPGRPDQVGPMAQSEIPWRIEGHFSQAARVSNFKRKCCVDRRSELLERLLAER